MNGDRAAAGLTMMRANCAFDLIPEEGSEAATTSAASSSAATTAASVPSAPIPTFTAATSSEATAAAAAAAAAVRSLHLQQQMLQMKQQQMFQRDILDQHYKRGLEILQVEQERQFSALLQQVRSDGDIYSNFPWQ